MSVPLFTADDSRRAARGKVLLNLVSKTPETKLEGMVCGVILRGGVRP
jgi:hypothetical protein